MPIDPSIPLGVRPVQLENPMNALAQAQQFSVNALKMQEAEQVMAERNALRGLDINAPDYISQVGRVNPKLALELQKGQLETKRGQVDLEGKLMANARNTLAPINDQSTYDVWRKQTSAQLPGIAPFLPPVFDDKVKTSLMLEADKYIAQTRISASQQQTNLTNIRGQDISAQTTRRGQDLVDLRTREGQAMQYNPDLQAKIAEAKASGEFMGKNKAAAAAALPGALEAASEGIRLIDEMVGQAEVRDKSGKVITKGTAPHPGFSSYVGASVLPGQRFLEGSDTASFEVRQKQIEGKAFLEAFQTLKGGGAITEKEGEKGTAAIMRMNKASSEKEYVAAARELQGILRTGMDRARTKAGAPAPSGGGATPPSPPPPGAGGNTVTIPSGKVLTFPTPEAAAAYRQAAGL
jgi:hypothetical protein